MVMTSDVNNIKLGACSVTFGAEDLGYTKGGVEVSISTSTYKINVDQFGETEVNEYITGRTASVKCPLAETSLDRFQIMFPGATVVTDGTDSTKKKLQGFTAVGTSLRTLADELTLHPKNVASNNYAEDVTLPIASPKGEISFAFKHNEERVYNVEFMGYPDLTTGLLYVIGDKTAAA